MNNLPLSAKVEVGHLARIFDDTAASYKFLLFRSILDAAVAGEERIAFKDLAFKSISWAWYAIHFYHLSFGKSDRMTRWVSSIDEFFNDRVLISDMVYHKINEAISHIDQEDTLGGRKILNHYVTEFSKMVPYRLLAPWFTRDDFKGLNDYQKNKKIMECSGQIERQCLYSIKKEDGLFLYLNPAWQKYLNETQMIIKGWWKSHFIYYLQKNNPTVLSIVTKLEPPVERNMGDVKKLFRDYYKFTGEIPRCIYSNNHLDIIHHDHFFPWSFLGSDPLYNFVPTTNNINSSKSNLIPSEEYLHRVATFQFEIFDFIRKHKPKMIEPFLNDLRVEEGIGETGFVVNYREFYKPLFITARNQGFETGWMCEKNN